MYDHHHTIGESHTFRLRLHLNHVFISYLPCQEKPLRCGFSCSGFSLSKIITDNVSLMIKEGKRTYVALYRQRDTHPVATTNGVESGLKLDDNTFCAEEKKERMSCIATKVCMF